MALENLFIRTKKEIQGIKLDAVLYEQHDNTVRLTRNPIEVGADITDHAIVEPKVIRIVAEVSDTPLGTAAFGQIIDNITGLFGTSTSENLTRSQTAFRALVQLQEQREPITVQTKLQNYENMMITRIVTPQDKDSSRSATMTITCEEVIITESQIVALTAEQLEPGATQEQAQSPSNRGRQNTTTPTDATNRSVLKTVYDWIN